MGKPQASANQTNKQSNKKISLLICIRSDFMTKKSAEKKRILMHTPHLCTNPQR